ncbi:hypothetical protein JDV02_010465 [Purpureocillium takamizusanense]|uniref:Alginate lyase domain-containing protein n=1 Tax=Purpureocillium takamizusanense TaxID=2060973 RepID=A0A9Q8VF81_9HYPO|nr:uncharacterized protein JDV02_010465 [Purpureocillium takamizusanense]UNI24740.1 hypothetical protein JDV02_010465 [Purpureocillium takamizusanense]
MKLSMSLPALAAITSMATVQAAPQPNIPPPTKTVEADDTAKRAVFKHPGIFVDQARLDLMASKVGNAEQPWAAAYAALEKHEFATRAKPTPYPTVECGPYSTPDVGCRDERADAMAAYANALMWAATGDRARADRAIGFMNAWAQTVKAHTNSNAPLQAAWAAADWVRAGEIIRYTDAGWKSADVAAFGDMLRKVYLPLVKNGSRNPNNWELVLNEAAIGIAVFLDDKATYDATMKRFLRSAAQYFYLKTDGPRPVKPAGMTDEKQNWWWDGQIARGLEDGIAMEICRDLTHTGYGIASVSHIIETSKIQGRDLYKEEVGTRLRYALEFQTKYDPNGGAAPVPSWLCGGKLALHLEDVTEPGWNAMGREFDMPWSGGFTMKHRPAGANTLFVGWETLTHAQ